MKRLMMALILAAGMTAFMTGCEPFDGHGDCDRDNNDHKNKDRPEMVRPDDRGERGGPGKHGDHGAMADGKERREHPRSPGRQGEKPGEIQSMPR